MKNALNVAETQDAASELATVVGGKSKKLIKQLRLFLFDLTNKQMYVIIYLGYNITYGGNMKQPTKKELKQKLIEYQKQIIELKEEKAFHKELSKNCLRMFKEFEIDYDIEYSSLGYENGINYDNFLLITFKKGKRVKCLSIKVSKEIERIGE